jgi:hypothetical protein
LLGVRFRRRLPRGWSYPVGAELLSHWLEPVEGAARNAVMFWDYHLRHSAHRDRLDEPFPILEVSYSTTFTASDIADLEHRGLPDAWEVVVHPVASRKRALIRDCLAGGGLLRVRQWLEQTRLLQGRQGRGFCRILFDPRDDRLFIESRLDNFADSSTEPVRCQTLKPPAEGAG